MAERTLSVENCSGHGEGAGLLEAGGSEKGR